MTLPSAIESNPIVRGVVVGHDGTNVSKIEFSLDRLYHFASRCQTPLNEVNFRHPNSSLLVYVYSFLL